MRSELDGVARVGQGGDAMRRYLLALFALLLIPFVAVVFGLLGAAMGAVGMLKAAADLLGKP
jgi:hypothetical protein